MVIRHLIIINTVVCPTPSTAAGVIITNTPPVTIGGSMLTFTCSGDNEVRTSTCGSSGWSPDPGTFDCSSSPTGIIIHYITCELCKINFDFIRSPSHLWLSSCTVQRQCGSQWWDTTLLNGFTGHLSLWRGTVPPWCEDQHMHWCGG